MAGSCGERSLNPRFGTISLQPYGAIHRRADYNNTPESGKRGLRGPIGVATDRRLRFRIGPVEVACLLRTPYPRISTPNLFLAFLAKVEPILLGLLISLVVIAVTLTILLWLGSLGLQNHFYTSPSEGLFWQAPLAALIISIFLFCWSLFNVWFAQHESASVPFGLFWEFTPRVEVIAEHVPQFESKRLTSEPAIYVIDKSTPVDVRYKKKNSQEYWVATGTEYVKFTHNGQEYKFVPDKQRSAEEQWIVFVDSNSGLEMKEFEIGRVGYTSWTRVALYLLLNATHLVLWIACFWLVLRYQLTHAATLGLIMWLVFSILVFPVLLAQGL